MMGCVVFTLMFFEHPFKESTKLTILNADFGFPLKNDRGLHSYPIQLEVILRNILNPDPIQRPSSSEVYKYFKQSNIENFKKTGVALSSKSADVYLESIKKLRIMSGGKLNAARWKQICRLFPLIPYKKLRSKLPKRFLEEMGTKAPRVESKGSFLACLIIFNRHYEYIILNKSIFSKL